MKRLITENMEQTRKVQNTNCKENHFQAFTEKQKETCTETKLEIEQKYIVLIMTNISSVYLNSEDVHQVKIGNFIYSVEPCTWLTGSKIGLNCLQNSDLQSFMYSGQISIQLLPLVQNFYIPELQSVSIKFDNRTNKRTLQNTYSLICEIQKTLMFSIVNTNQRFSITIDKIEYWITILDTVNSVNYTFGRITSNTQICIDKNASLYVSIYDFCMPIRTTYIQASIIKCTLPFTITHSDNNMLIDKTVIYNIILNLLYKVRVFSELETYTIPYFSTDLTIQIRVQSPYCHSSSSNKLCYILSAEPHQSPFQVTSSITKVQLVDGFKKCSKACFTITTTDKTLSFLPSEHCIKSVRDNIGFVVKAYTYFITIDTIVYTIKPIQLEPKNTNTDIYIIDSETSICFQQDEILKLINSNVAKQAETIKIKILTCTYPKQKVLNVEKLEKSVISALPKEFCIGNKFSKLTILYKNSISLNVSISSILPEFKKEKYTLMKDTTFDFYVSKKCKTCILSCSSSSSPLSQNTVESLKTYVGGLDTECVSVLKQLTYSRGPLKEEFILRGCKAPKGMVLYGSPGVGKTLLARKMGSIFGCTKEPYLKYVLGPEIFNKWVGDSERNIRLLFKPAKQAWKKLGYKSPLYMVVIDEIDSFLAKRGNSVGNSTRDTVVNQFLAELDGLIEFENILVIGLTNRLEMIDEAVLRPGRLGIHIEIKKPNTKARKEIFEICTRKLYEVNRISPNVSLDKLVEKTDDFTGADIENLVLEASNLSLERMSQGGNTGEISLVTEEDFTKSLKNIKTKLKMLPFIPSMYI